jgi:hypothetical protein
VHVRLVRKGKECNRPFLQKPQCIWLRKEYAEYGKIFVYFR